MAFEKDKPIELQDVKDKLDEKVNTSDVFTLKEIVESTDLTGKVASASSAKELNDNRYYFYKLSSTEDVKDYVNAVGSGIVMGDLEPEAYIIFNISWVYLRFKINSYGIYVSYKYGKNPFSTPVKIA